MRVMRNIGSSIDPPTRSRECILRLVKVAKQATRNWLTSLATHTHTYTHKYTLHDNKNHRMHHEKCQAGSPTNNYSLPPCIPPPRAASTGHTRSHGAAGLLGLCNAVHSLMAGTVCYINEASKRHDLAFNAWGAKR